MSVNAPADPEAMRMTFQTCLSAAADPEHYTLVGHLWGEGNPHQSPIEAMLTRRREMLDTLGVMAGSTETHYGKESDTHPFSSHKLHGTSAGFIGLPCSMVSTRNKKFLTDYYADTGLLLLNAPPIFVAPYDAWTTYFQKPENIPKEESWLFLRNLALTIHKPSAENIKRLGVDYFYTHPEERARLGGQFAALYLRQHDPHISLVQKQGSPEDLDKGFILLDPEANDVLCRARAAYTELANIPCDETGRETEVNVNAKLEHIAGIIVYMKRGEPLIHFNSEESLVRHARENGAFAERLAKAFAEYDILVEFLAQHHIDKTPTIAIYQPHAKEPLIDASPTQALRREIKGIVSELNQPKSWVKG